jgi:transposase
VTNAFDSLPSDLAAAHALILAERTARKETEARAARTEADLTHAQATASSADALIARLTLEIEKLQRTLYGARSERKERRFNEAVEARRGCDRDARGRPPSVEGDPDGA